MTLNLRHVRLFLAVAEDLHFTKAAQRSNIAQPALSRAIRLLETELGVALFRRNTRKVELTPAGRLFRAEARAALDHLDRAVGAARAAGKGEAGVLRIGYMEFAIEGVFPEILKQFRSRYPGVAVVPKSSFTERIQADLQQREIDVGFVIGPVERPGLASLAVQNDPFVAVVSDSHPLAGEAEVSLADLAGEPLIMGRRETWAPFLRRVEALCRTAGFAPNVIQEADTTESIFALVASGMGSTIYVARAFNDYRRGISIRPLKDVRATVRTEAAWRAADDNPLVRHFVALMKERAAPV